MTVALLAGLGAGCSKKEMRKPSDESVRATKALGALQEMDRAYAARDMAGVLKHVSPALAGGYSEFESSIRKDMESYPRVSLDMSVERVEDAGDEVSVVFHWFGRWYDASGREVEGRGNTVFVFRASGEMTLVRIVGDTPYGVVR